MQIIRLIPLSSYEKINSSLSWKGQWLSVGYLSFIYKRYSSIWYNKIKNQEGISNSEKFLLYEYIVNPLASCQQINKILLSPLLWYIVKFIWLLELYMLKLNHISFWYQFLFCMVKLSFLCCVIVKLYYMG